jgi:asparagine synthase (glutamine-hydrolysing)
MCGIAGVLALDGSRAPVTEEYVTRLREEMPHRGPDGAATWISDDAKVGLGFRRLAIIDLSDAAMQPMANEDGSIRVVFNGEIYNHAELRTELERLGGHTWRTDHADSEVIVHAFEHWGIECLQRFRGMFAIGIWDGREGEGELWLVRDRLGVKPLYYSVHHGRLVFASEITALLADPEQERVLDAEALYHYLSFLVTPPPYTLFRGIRKLPPATWLRFRTNGETAEERYWDPWDHARPLTGASEAEVAELLLEELRRSVHLRKVSDVPVGVFLSGGVDSSTNAALFSENEAEPVKTFSIDYEGDNPTHPSELSYARLAAGHVGSEHHERVLRFDELVDFLPRMARIQGEPMSNASCVSIYFISELARQSDITVAQVGEGSDELFLGYPAWIRFLLLQRQDDWPVPRLAKRAGVVAARLAGIDGDRIERLRRGAHGLPIFWSGEEAVTELEKRQLLGPRLGRELGGLTSWDVVEPIRARFEQRAWEQSHVNWMCYADLNLRLPEGLLMRLDRMSMRVGLEGRTPFLDHKFVELAYSIPTEIKTPNWELKHILKRAVRGLVPDEALTRRKQGLFGPAEWYDRLRPLARVEVDRFCSETDYLNRDAALRLLDERRYNVWVLLNLALWHREFF